MPQVGDRDGEWGGGDKNMLAMIYIVSLDLMLFLRNVATFGILLPLRPFPEIPKLLPIRTCVSMCVTCTVCMYVCNVCMYLRRYVRTYVCTYVCMSVCMYVPMYVCVYVCMYAPMYVCVCVYVMDHSTSYVTKREFTLPIDTMRYHVLCMCIYYAYIKYSPSRVNPEVRPL